MKIKKITKLISSLTENDNYYNKSYFSKIDKQILDIINELNFKELFSLYADMLIPFNKATLDYKITDSKSEIRLSVYKKYVKDIDSHIKKRLYNISYTSLDEALTAVNEYLDNTKYPNIDKDINYKYNVYRGIKEEVNSSKIYVKLSDLDKFEFKELIDFNLKYTFNIDDSLEDRIVSSLSRRNVSNDDLEYINYLIDKYTKKSNQIDDRFIYDNLNTTDFKVYLNKNNNKEIYLKRIEILNNILSKLDKQA